MALSVKTARAALTYIADLVQRHHFDVLTGGRCNLGERRCDQCAVFSLAQKGLAVASGDLTADLLAAASSIEGKSGISEEEESLARRLRVAAQEERGSDG